MREASKKTQFEEMTKKLEEELEVEKKKSKEYLNRLEYLQADFENYRKRVEKEVQEAVQRSNEKLVVCLIDIMDDLEKAVLAGKTTENKWKKKKNNNNKKKHNDRKSKIVDSDYIPETTSYNDSFIFGRNIHQTGSHTNFEIKSDIHTRTRSKRKKNKI